MLLHIQYIYTWRECWYISHFQGVIIEEFMSGKPWQQALIAHVHICISGVHTYVL